MSVAKKSSASKDAELFVIHFKLRNRHHVFADSV